MFANSVWQVSVVRFTGPSFFFTCGIVLRFATIDSYYWYNFSDQWCAWLYQKMDMSAWHNFQWTNCTGVHIQGHFFENYHLFIKNHSPVIWQETQSGTSKTVTCAFVYVIAISKLPKTKQSPQAREFTERIKHRSIYGYIQYRSL